MANTLSALNPEYWSKRVQYLLKNTLVANEICNYEEQSTMKNGDVVHRTIPTDITVNDYSAGSDVTVQDQAVTDETLSIDISKEVSTYYDMNEMKQNSLDYINQFFIDRAAYRLRDEMDARVLREIENAVVDFDDGDIGGTDGNGIAITKDNCEEVFSESWAKLSEQGVEKDKPRVAVVTPSVAAKMRSSNILNGYDRADQSLAEWFLSKNYQGKYLGWNVYESQNVSHKTVITYTGQPSADDAFDVAGVTFTFVASPSSAGDVDIGADADGSYANLAAAINGGAWAGSTYIALSTANRNTLTKLNVVATQDATANTLSIVTAGKATVQENESDPLDNATTSSTVALCYLARQGATDMVAQFQPTVQKNKAPLRNGYFFILWNLYGIKTFDEGTNRMIELNVNA